LNADVRSEKTERPAVDSGMSGICAIKRIPDDDYREEDGDNDRGNEPRGHGMHLLFGRECVSPLCRRCPAGILESGLRCITNVHEWLAYKAEGHPCLGRRALCNVISQGKNRLSHRCRCTFAPPPRPPALSRPSRRPPQRAQPRIEPRALAQCAARCHRAL
jgi:hypothetical protein